MNEDTIIFVSAYAGDKHQVETLLPVYLHHGCPVVILSPADAPITSVSDPNVHCMWMGRAGWAGRHTLDRHLLFIKAMLTFPQKWMLFHDADSACLTPEIPNYLYQTYAVFGNVVQDLNPGASHLPKVAIQPSYWAHREVWHALAHCKPADSYYGEVEGNPIPTDAIDHLMLQLAVGAGYPFKSFPDGASWETTSEHGLEQMAIAVRERGVRFVHQIKHRHVLDRLLRERR